jgi:hypothetical protein
MDGRDPSTAVELRLSRSSILAQDDKVSYLHHDKFSYLHDDKFLTCTMTSGFWR